MGAAGAARVRRLLSGLAARADAECLVHRGAVTSHAGLAARCRGFGERIEATGIPAGRVVAMQADYSPDSIALLLALLASGRVAALLPRGTRAEADLLADARAEGVFREVAGGDLEFEALGPAGSHPLLDRLAAAGAPGLVIFTSGSTGRAKAVLHDAERFLAKYDAPGKALRTLAFLLLDHVAGLDTLFYTLSAGGSLVLSERRDPESIAALLECHRVEVLPASPTFLELLCLSGAAERHDLSSVAIVTYGSEPMPAGTLARVAERFPRARLIQKYGTSECGSPRSRSRGRDSLWLHLKDGEIETRVVDGILWLRSPGAMLGYLNAASPFDADGWYCTGDRVEQDGEWIRILGRESEVINVGGEKVDPAAVEAVILELDPIEEVAVSAMRHPLAGQVVKATVRLRPDAAVADPAELRRSVRLHCRKHLAPHMVPVKVEVTDAPLTTERQKKRRR